MRRTRRVAMAGLIAVATAGAAPVAARAEATSGARVPECQSHQLVTTVDNGEGAAGSVFYKLQFANLGSACTLSGFPGVSAVNAAGKQLGKAAQRTGRAGKTVTLPAAGDTSFSTASATLRIVDALNYPATKCDPVLAYGLRVYPPDQKAGVAVPLPFAACSTSSVASISISTIKAG